MAVSSFRTQTTSVCNSSVREPPTREEWPLESSHPYGTHRLWTDTAGRTWILHLAMPATDMDAMLRGVVIVRGPDGTHLDTLPGPTGDFDPPVLTASSEPRGPGGYTGHRTEPVPFSPAALWGGPSARKGS